jgi:2-polyprenyl-3-methyl-5-hydroxy-6-metoxy-1,4-benzoquinol methylase
MNERMAEGSAKTALTVRELSRLAGELFRDSPWVTRTLQRYRPFICPFDRLLEHIPADATVMDVGCGNGLLLGALAARGCISSGVGFDASASAINSANMMAKRIRSPGTGTAKLKFEKTDATGKWPGGSFDVVTIVDVIHHVPPRAQKDVLDLAADRVKPGGVLLYKDMADHPMWRAQANRLHDLLLARQWINYMPIKTVENWAKERGLELAEKQDINRYFYGHQLRIFRKTAQNSDA